VKDAKYISVETMREQIRKSRELERTIDEQKSNS